MNNSEARDRASVAALLKNLRAKQGLSLQGFAKASGLSRSMVAKLEAGLTVPTLTTLRKMAKVFGMTLSEVIQNLDTSLVFYKTNISEVERRISTDGSFESHPISSRSFDRQSEVFDFKFLKPGEHSAVRPSGTIVGIFVQQGEMELETNGVTILLGPGDFAQFRPAKTYIYRQRKKKLAMGNVFIRYE